MISYELAPRTLSHESCKHQNFQNFFTKKIQLHLLKIKFMFKILYIKALIEIKKIFILSQVKKENYLYKNKKRKKFTMSQAAAEH